MARPLLTPAPAAPICNCELMEYIIIKEGWPSTYWRTESRLISHGIDLAAESKGRLGIYNFFWELKKSVNKNLAEKVREL